MSIVRCEGAGCANQIDTDIDTECEVYIGNMRRLHAMLTLCPGCRDRHQDELDYATGYEPPEPVSIAYDGKGLK